MWGGEEGVQLSVGGGGGGGEGGNTGWEVYVEGFRLEVERYVFLTLTSRLSTLKSYLLLAYWWVVFFLQCYTCPSNALIDARPVGVL